LVAIMPRVGDGEPKGCRRSGSCRTTWWSGRTEARSRSAAWSAIAPEPECAEVPLVAEAEGELAVQEGSASVVAPAPPPPVTLEPPTLRWEVIVKGVRATK
jgi:hypothetical protein